jgi:hypothetical protein
LVVIPSHLDRPSGVLLLSLRIGAHSGRCDSDADGKVTPGDQEDPEFRSKAGAERQTGAGGSPSGPQAVQAKRPEIREAGRCRGEDRKAGSAARTAATAGAAASQAHVP